MNWAETGKSDPDEWAIEDSCQASTSKGSTKSLVERGRKLYVICEFNLIEKHVRGNTAIPPDVNKLTATANGIFLAKLRIGHENSETSSDTKEEYL